MTDEADRADQEIARELAEALRLRRPEGPAADGFCHYCGEALQPTQRFCRDTGCASEWEYEQSRLRANGARR